MEFTYPFDQNRRDLLKSLIAAPLLAQAPAPAAVATAEERKNV